MHFGAGGGRAELGAQVVVPSLPANAPKPETRDRDRSLGVSECLAKRRQALVPSACRRDTLSFSMGCPKPFRTSGQDGLRARAQRSRETHGTEQEQRKNTAPFSLCRFSEPHKVH